MQPKRKVRPEMNSYPVSNNPVAVTTDYQK